MPAVNTPQFSWVLSRLPRHPQPVPPIYQPEVPADAIHFAAHHRRREIWVGASTAAVITGQKLAPWLGDWYLARTGYASQQYDGPPSGRRDNLFHPIDDRVDYGAHGAFDARAHGRSIELWAAKRRPWLTAAVAVIGLASAAFLIAKKLQVVT
jgi:hypothetical protein